MSDASVSELAEALRDVRKAHRLLAAFYQRAFDCISLIYQRLGYKYYYYHSDTAYAYSLRAYGNLGVEQDAQFLPLAVSYFLFLRPTRREEEYESGVNNRKFPNDSMLVIQLVADSALTGNHYPPPLDLDGETYIAIWVVKSMEVNDDNWYHGVFLTLKDRLNSLLKHSKDSREGVAGVIPPYAIYGEKWDLAELPNAKALSEKAAKYAEMVNQKLGLDLKIHG